MTASHMLVRFSTESISTPILEITDNKLDQVVIRFLPYQDEHITIHKDYSKCHDRIELLRTIHSLNKPEEVWDKEIIHIARDICHYSDPEKHGKYIDQNSLEKLSNVAGYFLIGKLIDLNTFKPKPKYFKEWELEVKVSEKRFMLNLYLSTPDNLCEHTLQRIETSLGEICFKISEMINYKD